MGEWRNWQTRRLQVPHDAGSNPASPTSSMKRCPFVQPEGQRSLKASIVVRIHDGQRRRRARLRLRFRTADGPGRHRVAAHLCSYSNHGREAGPRCRMLRVRLPPSARSQRLPAHACLVATVSTPPRYGGSRGSTPRAGSVSTCGCSSAWLRALPCHGRGRPFNRVSRSHALVVELR